MNLPTIVLVVGKFLSTLRLHGNPFSHINGQSHHKFN